MLGVPMDAVTKQVFLVGMLTSAVVGYATVTYFLRYLVGHGLAVFAWYRIALAAVTLVWLFL
jgi:undecaprenyl-diphosphatase